MLHLHQDIGNRATSLLIQTKLQIGAPTDRYEQEAGRVAEVVLRMPAPIAQRACAGCVGGAPCPDCQEEAKEEELPIQRVGAAQSRPSAFSRPVLSHIGPGRALDPNALAFFEPVLGMDFSGVRVHTNSAAAAAASAVRARAFTMGRDIVFAAGEYAPDRAPGRRLLAHELVHVVQQQAGEVRRGSRGVLRVGTSTQGARANGWIQRYEGYEHQALGDEYLEGLVAFLTTDEGERWARSIGFSRDTLVAQIRGDPISRGGRIRLRREVSRETGRVRPVQLTPGEIIALMGDFYETWEALAAAPEDEIRGILRIMAQEHAGSLTTPEAAARYEEITRGRYIGLAERNDVHFARRNKREWRRLHDLAIAEAQAAGRERSEARFHTAILIDAAAGHFLTDAFAAGHLLDKIQIMAAISLHLASNPVRAGNPQMQVYLAVIDVAGKMPQLVLKNLHDRLNREGFWVTNIKGLRWRTFGDNYLERAQETQRIAALAVFLSRQQLQTARTGQSPDPAEVEALMPDDETVRRATNQAIGYIPDAVREAVSLIYANRALAPTQFGGFLGTIVESNLSTIANPAREQEVVDLVESANRFGREGAVAPQLTIFSWK